MFYSQNFASPHTIASIVNGDEADAVLQSVLLWTCARLFDWVITLFPDALACDEQDESISLIITIQAWYKIESSVL